VISPTLESFSIASSFLLQDDPEWGGEGQHSQEAPVLIPESAQDDTGDVSVQEKEAARTLEDKQNWVNEELQQDSVQDMDPSMGLSDEQDPVVEELQQALVLGSEQHRATASESESPMPAFQDLSSPACLSFPRSDLLVYSRRRQRKRQETQFAVVGMEIPTLGETPLTTNEGADTQSSATINLQDDQSVGVAVPRETPLTVKQPLSSREAFVAKLVQHTASILAAPNSIRRDAKQQAPGVTPRRSRRITGARAECSLNELETRSRKKDMRALSIINEQGGVTDQASEEYSKLFGNPLTDAHLKALAGLFNWSIPELLYGMCGG
jgi:hypothetical protein